MTVSIQANSYEEANAAINALMLPPQHPNNKEYFKRELENLKQTVGPMQEESIRTAEAIHHEYWNPHIEQMYNSMVRYMAPIVSDDYIYPIYYPEDLVNPSALNQRYIMAYPDLREAWYNGETVGYPDYQDVWYRGIEDSHYDYRRAVDGMMQLEEDRWIVKTHTEGIDLGERPLSLMEKANIQITWNTIAQLLAEGVDPLGGHDDDKCTT